MKVNRLRLFWYIVLSIALLIVFIYQAKDLVYVLDNWNKRVANSLGEEFYQTMLWLKEHSNEGDVVLTQWTYGTRIVALAQRPTVATCKVYPSEAREVAKRYNAIDKFLFTKNEEIALEITREYNVKYVFFSKLAKVAKEAKHDTILNKMKTKKRLDNFRLIYESKQFMIYKVILN